MHGEQRRCQHGRRRRAKEAEPQQVEKQDVQQVDQHIDGVETGRPHAEEPVIEEIGRAVQGPVVGLHHVGREHQRRCSGQVPHRRVVDDDELIVPDESIDEAVAVDREGEQGKEQQGGAIAPDSGQRCDAHDAGPREKEGLCRCCLMRDPFSVCILYAAKLVTEKPLHLLTTDFQLIYTEQS